MSHPASEDDEVANAREAIVAAQTVEQLRQAHAVVLPLAYGLSLLILRWSLVFRRAGRVSCIGA